MSSAESKHNPPSEQDSDASNGNGSRRERETLFGIPLRYLELAKYSVPLPLRVAELKRHGVPDIVVDSGEGIGPPYYPPGSPERAELNGLLKGIGVEPPAQEPPASETNGLPES
jgi:hypothetical protein